MIRRRNMSFSPEVDQILAQIGEGPSSASAYVSDLVLEAHQRWTDALHSLLSFWSRRDVLAIYEMMESHPLFWSSRSSVMNSDEGESIRKKHSISENRWFVLSRSNALSKSDMDIIFKEMRRGNTLLSKVLLLDDSSESAR